MGLNQVGEGTPQEDLAAGLQSGLDDEALRSRVEGENYGVTDEAGEPVEREFRGVEIGKRSLEQLRKVIFLGSFGQNGGGGHHRQKRNKRNGPLTHHISPRPSKPLVTQNHSYCVILRLRRAHQSFGTSHGFGFYAVILDNILQHPLISTARVDLRFRL